MCIDPELSDPVLEDPESFPKRRRAYPPICLTGEALPVGEPRSSSLEGHRSPIVLSASLGRTPGWLL